MNPNLVTTQKYLYLDVYLGFIFGYFYVFETVLHLCLNRVNPNLSVVFVDLDLGYDTFKISVSTLW